MLGSRVYNIEPVELILLRLNSLTSYYFLDSLEARFCKESLDIRSIR